jgi:hypothetical protein
MKRSQTKLSGGDKRLSSVRYWSLLVAKLALCGAVSYGLLHLIDSYWSSPLVLYNVRAPRVGLDLVYTSVIGVWFLVSAGLLYLCIWDQRYRCRVCLRRLRMPIETGSWSRMLLVGRPRIEYICPYGHGTLKEEELHLTGADNEWTESGDMWEELCAASKDVEPGR